MQAGFPGPEVRAVAIAVFLRDHLISDIQDLAGIAHEIPLLSLGTSISRTELTWLVNCAIRITKDTEVKRVALKRKSPEIVDATMLVSHSELMLRSCPSSLSDLNVSNYGPAKAARLLHVDAKEKQAWLRNARNMAIAGSCPLSHDQLKSGVRAYAAFASRTGMTALPPTVDMLLAWSCMFRSSLTFQNYVTSLRTACQLAGIPVDHTYNAVLKKAARAIDKRRGFVSRPPMFIGIDLIRQIVLCIGDCPSARVRAIAMAFLTTYVFLLRMPSECLPIRVAEGCSDPSDCKASIFLQEDHLILKLKRRKNRDGGSVLKRACWCSSCKVTCPVHVLAPYFVSCGAGCMPFEAFDAKSALSILRGWLQHLGIPDALAYRTHDIRRGHARDLMKGGARLHEILAAGDWKSAAFLKYLDSVELESGATLEAHVAESSSDDES